MMNMLLKVFAVGCLICCAMAQIAQIAQNPCDAIIPAGSDGFVDDPSACANYFSCVRGEPYRASCPFPFVYFNETCTTRTSKNCQLCPATGVAKVKDVTSCSKWILCINGVALEQQCDFGTLFNPVVGDCDLTQNVQC